MSAGNWLEANGNPITVKHTGGDAAQGWHAYLRPIGSATVVEAAVRVFGPPSATDILGVVFADGTTAGSGKQVSVDMQGNGNFSLRSWTGFNAFGGELAGSPSGISTRQIGGEYHVRLTWVSANTWRGEVSSDGKNWMPHNFTNGQADAPFTMTPTHVGVWCSTYGSGANVAAIFDFDRISVS